MYVLTMSYIYLWYDLICIPIDNAEQVEFISFENRNTRFMIQNLRFNILFNHSNYKFDTGIIQQEPVLKKCITMLSNTYKQYFHWFIFIFQTDHMVSKWECSVFRGSKPFVYIFFWCVPIKYIETSIDLIMLWLWYKEAYGSIFFKRAEGGDPNAFEVKSLCKYLNVHCRYLCT